MHRRMLAIAVVGSMAAAGPIAGAQGAASKAKTLVGVVFGGVTAQDYPIVIELNKTATQVVKADVALDLTCQAPDTVITIPDGFTKSAKIVISKTGRFSAQQPVTRIPADPAQGIPGPVDVSASITGRLNAARTRITGTWQRKLVLYDPADPTATKILESCDSGAVKYSAKQ